MRITFTIAALAATLVLATVATAQSGRSTLRSRGEAPELRNNVFFNTETPLRLENLRGSVVLLEFWTFDCINCIRTIPHVQQWHETYAADGLVVIGDHYPEFSYERDPANVEAAINRLGITYPVAQDNARLTWGAYNQRYWPTMYLIGKNGNIRYMHIGEGKYAQTEAAIQTLLAEPFTPQAAPDGTVTEVRKYIRATEPLNVRTGPGINHGRVATISTELVMVVLGEQNGWYEIEYDGKPGHYVSGEYVTVGEW
ncbi:MAG: redoxin domain-containing protein [Chloroflexota bacterium]